MEAGGRLGAYSRRRLRESDHFFGVATKAAKVFAAIETAELRKFARFMVGVLSHGQVKAVRDTVVTCRLGRSADYKIADFV
jgi:hypothetical protein